MTERERMVIRSALDIARRKEAEIEELRASNDALAHELDILARKRKRVTVRAERMRRKIMRLEARNEKLSKSAQKWRMRFKAKQQTLVNARLREQRLRYAAKRAA